MNPFSVCIIAKNEGKNIERCLKSLQVLDCETILCDEWIESVDVPAFLKLSANYPEHIGLLKRINLLNPHNRSSAYTDQIPRFFDRQLFSYREHIHEQVVSLSGQLLNGFELPLVKLHTGYVGTPEEIELKHKRNISMPEKESPPRTIPIKKALTHTCRGII